MVDARVKIPVELADWLLISLDTHTVTPDPADAARAAWPHLNAEQQSRLGAMMAQVLITDLALEMSDECFEALRSLPQDELARLLSQMRPPVNSGDSRP